MINSNNILYVGVNDHDIDLFEGQYIVPNGMAYNSYVILDEKIAIFDSVDSRFAEKWLLNIKEILKDKIPDYIVVHHIEQDNSVSLVQFLNN
ncbi:MAG: FprA family A-type flavoprotein, partial [Clostridia bacterium]|nr:FprA family A-type flavoprotein [Clostridia bacterium]